MKEKTELAKKRLSKGNYDTDEIAEKVGCSRQHISQIENQTSLPSVKLAKKLAPFYGIKWTYFFDDNVI